ncbi:MAG: hypothetical protein QXX41_11580 [Nitrososphaerota archaeon]
MKNGGQLKIVSALSTIIGFTSILTSNKAGNKRDNRAWWIILINAWILRDNGNIKVTPLSPHVN